MTRLAAVQVAGYYPTQPALLPLLTALITRPPGPHTDLFCDPCAGEGEALAYIVESLYDTDSRKLVSAHIAELEKTRAQAAEKRLRTAGLGWGDVVVHKGDALRLDVGREPATHLRSETGASLLYLNPPYDTDSRFRRLEARFLAKFAPALASDGVLLFIVPAQALAHCADILARGFTAVDILRYPEPEFSEFKQVVVRATKLARDLTAPNPAVLAEVQAAATPEGCAALRVLGQPIEPVELPITPPAKRSWCPAGEDPYEPGEARMVWKERAVDLDAVRASFRPWGSERAQEPIPGVFPIFDTSNPGSTRRRFSAAVPLKPAHIAAAIAAGTFNGAAVVPADPSAGFHPLMVKGVFTRQWRTVEERENAQGEATVDVQVEEPLLEVTALDLRTLTMHRLEPSPNVTGECAPAKMSTGDLLVHYTPSLLRTLEEQCPTRFDPTKPGARFPLTETGRPLYPSQADAARALLTLLGGPPGTPKGRRKGTFVFLIGEVGCGKSGTFLVTARNAGANTVLIVCPPHLGAGWTDEVRAVWPEAAVVTLDSTSAVDTLAARRAAGDATPVVAILTRETAKLGHAWEGVPGAVCACTRTGARPRPACPRCAGSGKVAPKCPRCGAPTPAVDLAARRARCEGGTLVPTTYASAVGLAVLAHLRGQKDIVTAHLTHLPRTHASADVAVRAAFETALYALAHAPTADRTSTLHLVGAAVNALAIASGDAACMLRAAEALLSAVAAPPVDGADTADDADAECGGTSTEVQHTLRYIAAKLIAATRMSAPGWERACETIRAVDSALADKVRNRSAHLYDGAEDLFEWHLTDVRRGPRELAAGEPAPDPALPVELVTTIGTATVGAVAEANTAISALLTGVQRAPCGEPLYAAIPQPRRTPLATYILRKHRGLFDFLGLDEAHEYGADGSAQERAAHRLTGLRIPVVLLTGSLLNGFAHHMFASLWALSRKFRELYGRGDRERFAQRYGYRKRIVPAGTGETTYGAVTDRVETSGVAGKDAGAAPGVQPLAILEWIVPHSVTLHKHDLRIAIPEFTAERHEVVPSTEQLKLHAPMLSALVEQVKRDLFSPLSGALWGALSEAPSHLDRMCADAGNCPDGSWEVRYPANRELPPGVDRVIYRAPPLPASTVLPKEQWMLDRLEEELSGGRSVILLPYHTDLYARLARLARARTGLPVSILHPEKVPTAKRQAWITGELSKGCRVLVTGPTPISTGLNVLTAFSTVIWAENPACNAITLRQVEGRIDRIGQTRPTRSLFPVYGNSVQTAMHTLLMQKVAVSRSTDGLDARSALQAAGVGESGGLSALSMGRLLFDVIEGRRVL